MRTITVIGIGPGNPEQVTIEAIRALNAADLVLIPRKGAARDDLAGLRREICARYLDNPATRLVEEPPDAAVALLVWGDPSLYDSTLRILDHLAAGGLAFSRRVVPGITSLQALAAAHRIPLNAIGGPVHVTTGRRLSAAVPNAETIAVMLDGELAFRDLPGEDWTIWWAAYLGMPDEIAIAGPLDAVADRIAEAREDARKAHGWIMDTYLLRRR